MKRFNKIINQGCLLLAMIILGSCANKGIILVKVDDKEIGTFASIEAALEASRAYSSEDRKSIQIPEGIPEGKFFLDQSIKLDNRDLGLIMRKKLMENHFYLC